MAGSRIKSNTGSNKKSKVHGPISGKVHVESVSSIDHSDIISKPTRCLRIFTEWKEQGYALSTIATMVKKAIKAAPIDIDLIVLPAGVSRLSAAISPENWWTEPLANTAKKDADATAQKLHGLLGRDVPPVVFGLDGAVTFQGRNKQMPYLNGAQLAVVIHPDKNPHIAWKSNPVGIDEDCIYISWDEKKDAPTSQALSNNNAIATINGERALCLICHDGTAFANTRWLSRAQPKGWRVEIRKQYANIIKQEKPSFAVNILHQVPMKPTGNVPTAFINGHNNLEAGIVPLPNSTKRFPGLPVISVAGLPAKLSNARYERIRQQLRCSMPHIDVRIKVKQG